MNSNTDTNTAKTIRRLKQLEKTLGDMLEMITESKTTIGDLRERQKEDGLQTIPEDQCRNQ